LNVVDLDATGLVGPRESSGGVYGEGGSHSDRILKKRAT
jgi:hypothetical protein